MGIIHFDYLYPELAKVWAPNNKVSIDSFVPLLTEKGLFMALQRM